MNGVKYQSTVPVPDTNALGWCQAPKASKAPDTDYCCRGQVLILVLWVMGILTVAMGVLITRSTHELRLGEIPLQLIQRQAVAQAGVWQASAVVKQDDPAVDHLGEAWATGVDPATEQQFFIDRGAGKGTFSIGVADNQDVFQAGLIDEQRKLNINTAAPGQLTRLIEQLIPDAPAAELAAAAVDWRDEPAGLFCQAATAPCHNAPFDTVDELRLVPGITPAIFEAMKPYVTVYGTGLVNVNTAPVVVLDAIGGKGENWVEQRKNQPFTSSPDTSIPNLGVASTDFTVAVQAHLTGGGTTYLQAVIDREGRILSWNPQ